MYLLCKFQWQSLHPKLSWPIYKPSMGLFLLAVLDTLYSHRCELREEHYCFTSPVCPSQIIWGFNHTYQPGSQERCVQLLRRASVALKRTLCSVFLHREGWSTSVDFGDSGESSRPLYLRVSIHMYPSHMSESKVFLPGYNTPAMAGHWGLLTIKSWVCSRVMLATSTL